jgi:hypothetical protein
MANVHTYIRRAEFIFQEELTICNLYIEFIPNESAIVGTGWRTKTFPARKSAVDIMNEDCEHYLEWSLGREGVEWSRIR